MLPGPLSRRVRRRPAAAREAVARARTARAPSAERIRVRRGGLPMRHGVLLAFAVLALAGAASAVVSSVSRRDLSQGATSEVGGADFARPARAWLEMEDERRIPLRVL